MTMEAYEAILPPGWMAFDLTQPVHEAVTQMTTTMLAPVPKDIADAAQPGLVKQLKTALTGMADEGAVAAYLPVDDALDSMVRPVMAIRPVEFQVDGAEITPLDYLAALMAQEGVSLIEPEGMVGIKRVTDSDTGSQFKEAATELPDEILAKTDREGFDEALKTGRRTRQVNYVIGVPDQKERWMSVDASVSAFNVDGVDEALEAIEQFFDAWVSTIRWKDTADE